MKKRKSSAAPQNFNISRRRFMQRVVAAAALTGLPAWFVERQLIAAEAKPPKLGPNDRPGVALVGCGGMGKADATNASGYGDIVAVCDVDDNHAAAAAAQFTEGEKKPTAFHDFRKVLERDDVHVIVNATPDHWHSLINIAAAKAGKDIYAEKPLTLTIDEGRHVVDAVAKGGVVLQTGTQQRSSQRFRLACELVRNGRIGALMSANVWLPAGLRGGPFASAPVPEGLDWDFWLGQAPRVDYVPERCHGTFRFFYDYSGGTMTDWGAHHNDIAYWAVGQIAPRTVAATILEQPVPGGYDAISDYEVRYVYADGVQLNIRTTKDDTIYGAHINPDGQHNGIRFVGTEGWIWVNRDKIEASDPGLLRTPLPEGARRLRVSRDHMGNFFESVRSREQPICDALTGHRSAIMCHLGAISMRTGLALSWDYEAERFVGDGAAVANTYLARPMRAPYDYNFAG
jgi:predicted dehydrogenase